MTVAHRFWKTVPPRSAATFLLGVFFIFSTVSFAIDITEMGRQPALRLALNTIIAGIFPMFYALSGFALRSQFWKAMLPALVVHITLINVLARAFPSPPQGDAMPAATLIQLTNRLSMDAYAIICAVVLGYTCLAVVSVTEGRRYARVRAEIELATEIHRVLVPTIDTKLGEFEFYGASVPSGDVGGDLIDIAGSGEQWVAYVADVSGHGVAPGLVMGMVKSSARMLLTSGAGSGRLMSRLNEVLYPLKKEDMFITFCFLAREGGATHLGLAGHPPMLHFSAASGSVTQTECPNMPLGILPSGEFSSSEVETQPGDVFMLYTDGYVETADKSGEEFGLARLQGELQKHAREPLAVVASSLQQSVNAYGAQFDDMSILLIRHL
jgi:hypothetical protein